MANIGGRERVERPVGEATALACTEGYVDIRGYAYRVTYTKNAWGTLFP